MSLTIIETTNGSNPDSPEARDMIFDALMEHAGKQKFDDTRIVLLSSNENGSVVTDMKLNFKENTMHCETVRSKREDDSPTATDTLYHRINAMVDQEMMDIREGKLEVSGFIFGENDGE